MNIASFRPTIAIRLSNFRAVLSLRSKDWAFAPTHCRFRDNCLIGIVHAMRILSKFGGLVLTRKI